MPNENPTFEIGLVMAGAISGGAYAAGVLDFLIEALDEWEKAKTKGEDRRQPVPQHQVSIRVLSGASAGSMVASIAAVGLTGEIEPVRDPKNPPEPKRNRLFDSWVNAIDIVPLLALEDLKGDAEVPSALDSTKLEMIAREALDVDRRATPRSYLHDPLPIFLTVANLRGMPYGFSFFGSGTRRLYGMTRHMDHMGFSLSPTGREVPATRLLDPSIPQQGNWQLLADAALASGAFPVGLASRPLSRSYGDYEDRIPTKKPAHGQPLDATFDFVAVDGGLMNNEPIELAASQMRSSEGAENPLTSTGALLLIDPFPNEIDFDSEYEIRRGDRNSKTRLAAVLFGMFGALKNQARFKLEELKRAESSRDFTRFMISPTRRIDGSNDQAEIAMAAEVLGGFGAFFDREFRVHDFQLGRRNCQQFLRKHFWLAEGNEVFGAPDADLQAAWVIRDGEKPGEGEPVPVEPGTAERRMPIIPLCGTAYQPVHPWPWVGGPDFVPEALFKRLDLKSKVEERVRAVGLGLLSQELNAEWWIRHGFRWFVVGRITDEIMGRLEVAFDKLKAP